jgi:hypothetical protein
MALLPMRFPPPRGAERDRESTPCVRVYMPRRIAVGEHWAFERVFISVAADSSADGLTSAQVTSVAAAALLLERAPVANALPRGAVVGAQTPCGLVEFERRGADCLWGRLHPGDVQLRLWGMHAKISRRGVCAR